MTERTHLSQPDEALHRVRGDAPTETCRALLLQAAEHLTTDRPDQPMWEAVRIYLARRFAAAHFPGYNTELAAGATLQFLGHAPVVRAGQTRGEYALVLRAAAQA
ncbi:hypothetical protein OOK31_25470 [Streptomyces sp. NBC_00249]|uniref:hypothetical protein n=1 Tax=Streptomyces sp. NBC_00249 TaxID=2975690 RepID=UPI00224D1897|nr:hypothetical protein [Streptomyces sp. NBC_00249]MCX5197207.1 hypothetical protein [Streptomyces sp. NBC_00249]